MTIGAISILITDRELQSSFLDFRKAKVVMSSMTSGLNSTSEMIGKATTDKMTAKVTGKNSSFRFSVKNLFEHTVDAAAKHVCEILNFFFFCFFAIVIDLPVTIPSFVCLYLGILSFKSERYFCTLGFLHNYFRQPLRFFCLVYSVRLNIFV